MIFYNKGIFFIKKRKVNYLKSFCVVPITFHISNSSIIPISFRLETLKPNDYIDDRKKNSSFYMKFYFILFNFLLMVKL